MNRSNKKSVIPLWLNVVLLLFIFFGYLVEYFFAPEIQQKAPYEHFFDSYPLMAAVAAVILVIVLIGIGALLLQLFWNKFVIDVFKVRSIALQEAIAIILITAILAK